MGAGPELVLCEWGACPESLMRKVIESCELLCVTSLTSLDLLPAGSRRLAAASSISILHKGFHILKMRTLTLSERFVGSTATQRNDQ